MNILFIGDIFGRPGRNTVKKLLKDYRQKHNIHLAIANAENMHHGKGASMENIDEMRKAGVDFFTSGNHIWADRSIIPHLDDKKTPLIRPANYPSGVAGRGYEIVECGLMQKVLVINLMGRVFMPMHLDCPFKTADKILKQFENENLAAIFVDLHAEATSEKIALAHYLDGRITALIGTHTHVPTADTIILEGGTAFQSDAGFTGPVNSCIGVQKELIIKNFLTQIPVKHEVAEGRTVFNAVKIEVDDVSKMAVKIERVQEYLE